MIDKPDFSFQDDAIKNVCRDFLTDPVSKNLLVIPTGGGKTITAIRIINELIKKGFFEENKHAIWVTHRKQLKQQVENEIKKDKWANKFNWDKKLYSTLKIYMKDEASKISTKKEFEQIKLIIIDEAHHSAANTYKPFFNRNIGILGLTATPTRNDDSKLEFEKVSFEITFSELVKRKVIIKPQFRQIKTNIKIDITDLVPTESNLNKFNIKERNILIAESIFKTREKYKKVLVFVGSNKHVEDLFEVLNKTSKLYPQYYDHIGFIHSNKNEMNIDNNKYLEKHKKFNSSILVNCKLLTEGYDDPSINTIIMATPTKSILHYMQCIGRVVRNPEEAQMSEVYVLEFNDDLPNINYRIDNSWLFADISDYLEPKIIIKDVCNKKECEVELKKIFKEHNIDACYLKNITDFNEMLGQSVLLFSSNKTVNENSKWEPLILCGEDRKKYIAVFNFISNNINRYRSLPNTDWPLLNKLKLDEADFFFSKRTYRVDFMKSLSLAFEEIKSKQRINRLKYYIFNKVESNSEAFLEFISDCKNKKELLAGYPNRSAEIKYLVKLPLLLGGFEGVYITNNQYKYLTNLYFSFLEIKEKISLNEQENVIYNQILAITDAPFPIRFIPSVIIMAREELLIKCIFNLED
jgi:superfamily II DNA or RNA helicase